MGADGLASFNWFNGKDLFHLEYEAGGWAAVADSQGRYRDFEAETAEVALQWLLRETDLSECYAA